jgi:hypothetical protein
MITENDALLLTQTLVAYEELGGGRRLRNSPGNGEHQWVHGGLCKHCGLMIEEALHAVHDGTYTMYCADYKMRKALK